MRFNQSIVVITLLCMTVFVAQAEYNEDQSAYWSVKQEHEIGKASVIYVKFDTDKTIYCDLPLSDDDNKNGRTVVKKLQSWILKYMNEESNSIVFEPYSEECKDNDFIATIAFKDISEKGGVNCKMTLIQKNNPDSPKIYYVKVKDRKWNDTETLLKENAPKLGELLESDIWWTAHNGARK